VSQASAVARDAATTEVVKVRAPARPGGLRRFVLMVVLPAVAVVAGGYFWLSGGRYISTDNAYVGANKAMITPYISGPIVAIHVTEGQHVAVGDALFDIDPAPFQNAVSVWRGKVEAAKIEFANLKEQYKSNVDQILMAEQSVDLHQADYDRKHQLATSKNGTISDQDNSAMALVQAKEILEFVRSMQDGVKVKLAGGPDTTLETFPDYIQASAQLADAERNLGYTKIKAPIAGVATQVDAIELGRVAPVGQPVFAVVADTGLWVDANPKESDLTYVKPGMPASVSIDTFPDHEWKGTVCSIAPGTGAQFAILPPQNASGNWVKVVQRIPLRFCFDKDDSTEGLRAGMSAVVSVDTGRQRSLAGLWSGIASLVHGKAETAKP
jgi:membrane fusion protein, multidrug efflux system